jgi:UPF0755 protein
MPPTSILKSIYKVWFTLTILIIAIGGYCFYCVLWTGRLIVKLLGKIVTLLLVLALCVAGVAVWSFNYYFMPVKAEAAKNESVPVMIERGTNARAAADLLDSLGVVRSGKALYYWMRYNNLTDKVQAGRFTFIKGEGAVSAAEKLLKAETFDKTITVQEGFTIEQTAGKVAAQIEIDSAEFVRLCYDSAFIASLGIGEETLEGYLFPDTYRLPENSDAAAVVRRMAARFNEAYAGVEFSPWVKEKYNRHQILTLASIVEKEATLASERGRIAGVFHNRLKLGWPLGADPTVRYIFRKFSGPLYVSELNSPSPYNTRKFTGLPPGPICSPGLGAIQASARPDSTDDLFFVALWDGTGAHDFSVTNAGHDRKKLKIRRENELRNQKKGSK